MSDSDRVKSLFMEAIGRTGDDRARFVAACSEDPVIRERVEALVRAHGNASEFMETAAMESPQIDAGVGTPGDESPGAVIGRYKLLQMIGEGGFGHVWMAEQREPVKRRVALKIIKLGMDTKQVIARFEAERQALAMMDHPNIARVLDAGATDRGRPYFVMEYVRGVGILEYCNTEKLDTESRLNLFIKVCNAIQHAHQKGIIHRDIKPSNVLVTLHDGVPVPMVIDFGVAKATNTELTQKTLFTEHRQMIGTPAYMSPEQAEMSGLDIDTRSDIYSLGVLLYELLTGTTPFGAKELASKGYAEMMRIIREHEPHKPSARLSTLGNTGTKIADQRRVELKRLGAIIKGDLDWIVMKCLEKDRTRRYETANGLAADIKRHLHDEPVVAGPPGAAYKIRKFLDRNRAGVLAAAVVLFFLIGGLTVATAGLVHAKREQRAAEQARLQAQQAHEMAELERDKAREQEQRAVLLRRLFSREALSIAVLPLENASGDPEQEYFAQGMTRSLINDLDKAETIEIRSYESASTAADSAGTALETAALLDVDLLMTGSVKRDGDRVEIEISLDHAGEQLNLWSDTYTGEWSHVYDLQRRVSEDALGAVEINRTQQSRERQSRRDTENPSAREAYYKGMHNIQGATRIDADRAITFFDEAVRLDPAYALAHLGRARAHLIRQTLGTDPRENNEPARASAQRALDLDPTLAGAWAAIGEVRLYYDWDWPSALEAYERALELDPYLPAAHIGISGYYISIAEFDLGMEHMNKAIQLDPASLLIFEEVFWTPFFIGDMDAAIEIANRALDYDNEYWSPYSWRGLAKAWSGDVPGGVLDLERAMELEPNSPIAMALIASVYAMDGQRDKAQARLDDLLEWTNAHYVCPYEIATVFASMGDFESAYAFIEKALVARSECIPIMGVDVRMGEIRYEPRYQEIMREVNHPLAGHVFQQ